MRGKGEEGKRGEGGRGRRRKKEEEEEKEGEGVSASGSFEASAWNWQCNSLNILLVSPVTRTTQIQGVGKQILPFDGMGYKVTSQSAWI